MAQKNKVIKIFKNKVIAGHETAFWSSEPIASNGSITISATLERGYNNAMVGVWNSLGGNWSPANAYFEIWGSNSNTANSTWTRILSSPALGGFYPNGVIKAGTSTSTDRYHYYKIIVHVNDNGAGAMVTYPLSLTANMTYDD